MKAVPFSRSWATPRLVVCGLIYAIVATSAWPEDDTTRARIEALRAEIAHHDELYFREAAPEITDYEYDLLKLELRRLESQSGVARESTVALTDDRDPASPQHAHTRPMLSLDKAYNDDDVAAFWDKVVAASSADPTSPLRFSIEPKFDGIAVNVVLRRGRLLSAATRGDGAAGEDITAQVGVIRGLDYEWSFDTSAPRIEQIELRGEIFLTHAAFARLNQERAAAGEAPFRHPRSVAAGSIKLDDLGTVATRGLSIVFHGWGDVQPAEAAPVSVMAFQRWLDERGLPTVADARFVAPHSADALNAAAHALQAQALPFPTDGIVIKLDDVAAQTALGDGPTAPRWAIARKFAPPRAETVLRHIAWQVGRTGALTPVAEFDPVQLDGTTVARASLHNPAEITQRDLRLGDVVWIEKAGEIIPQVAGLVLEQRPASAAPYVMPTFCPECDSSLRRNGATLHCANFDCDAQVVQRLLHFASRGALNIRGLGPGLVGKLVEADLVRSPADLYTLDAAQLTALPGVGETTAQRLLEAIDESRAAPLWRVIVGLGLPGIGPASAKTLAGEIDDLADLLNDPPRLSLPPELRDTVARLAARWLHRGQ